MVCFLIKQKVMSVVSDTCQRPGWSNSVINNYATFSFYFKLFHVFHGKSYKFMFLIYFYFSRLS